MRPGGARLAGVRASVGIAGEWSPDGRSIEAFDGRLSGRACSSRLEAYVWTRLQAGPEESVCAHWA